MPPHARPVHPRGLLDPEIPLQDGRTRTRPRPVPRSCETHVVEAAHRPHRPQGRRPSERRVVPRPQPFLPGGPLVRGVRPEHERGTAGGRTRPQVERHVSRVSGVAEVGHEDLPVELPAERLGPAVVGGVEVGDVGAAVAGGGLAGVFVDVHTEEADVSVVVGLEEEEGAGPVGDRGGDGGGAGGGREREMAADHVGDAVGAVVVGDDADGEGAVGAVAEAEVEGAGAYFAFEEAGEGAGGEVGDGVGRGVRGGGGDGVGVPAEEGVAGGHVRKGGGRAGSVVVIGSAFLGRIPWFVLHWGRDKSGPAGSFRLALFLRHGVTFPILLFAQISDLFSTFGTFHWSIIFCSP
mmetsp:Transcript_19135/g.38053  ORF Transcript_19135/g.38053 Transcript_19135/m.38053 type:complete len:350 (+) Transcript_19135:27-1076(+)